MSKNICKDCLQEFSRSDSLKTHQRNIKCHKVILNTDGTIQNPVKFQCNNCYKILSNENNLNRHNESCKKKNKVVNNIIGNTVNGNNNIANNIITDNSITNTYININAPFYHIKPENTYKPIDDNYITIETFVPLLGKIFGNLNDKNYYHMIVNTIVNIVVNEYARNEDVFTRNSWSTESINNSNELDIHLFRKNSDNKGKWSIDEDGMEFFKGVVQRILEQLNDTVDKYIDIIDIFMKFDNDRLQKYIESNKISDKVLMCNSTYTLNHIIKIYSDELKNIKRDKGLSYDRFINSNEDKLSIEEIDNKIMEMYSEKKIYNRFYKYVEFKHIDESISKTKRDLTYIKRILKIEYIETIFFNEIKEKLKYDKINNIFIKEILNKSDRKDISSQINIT